MKYNSQSLGRVVRRVRQALGVTQGNLALTSGTGIRFIVDLEKGKPTCHVGKALAVLNTLGVTLTLTPPAVAVATDPAPRKN